MKGINTVLAYLLVAIGCISFIGHLVESQLIYGLGTLSVAAPLPLVFTDRYGMEDFASTYDLEWVTHTGQSKSKKLGREDFARLRGPFNRQDVYVTAIAYSPRLPAPLVKQVLRYGLCQQGPLAQAIGESSDLQAFVLNVRTQTTGRHDEWKTEGVCLEN